MEILWNLKNECHLVWIIYETLNKECPISFPYKLWSKHVCQCYGMSMDIVLP